MFFHYILKRKDDIYISNTQVIYEKMNISLPYSPILFHTNLSKINKTQTQILFLENF